MGRPLDHAAVKRAALDIVQNDLVGLRVGVGDPALHLVVHGGIGHEAEGLQFVVRVAGLAFQLRKINAPAVDTGRGAGLEPAQGQTSRFQALGQCVGRVHPVRAGSIPRIPHKNFATEVGACSNDHALGSVLAVQLGDNALHVAVFHLDGNHFRLMDGKAGRQFQRVLHIFVVTFTVGLDPQGMDCRALALVQHPALQVGGIRRQTHHAAECIQFTYQRSFCCSTNAGIAGHIADGIQAHGKNSRLRAQCGCRMGRFNARMARTDHDDVIISQMIHVCFPLIYSCSRTVTFPHKSVQILR